MASRWRRFFWLPSIALLAAVVLAACHPAPRGARVPAERGLEWREYTSERVQLVTNLNDDEARKIVYTFEQRYALLGHLLWGDRSPKGMRTRVVAFNDSTSFHMFMPQNAGAMFRAQLHVDPDDMPTVLMFGSPTQQTYSVWQHELTHRFLHYAMGPMPTWFTEGMAEYYGALHLEGKQWDLGRRSVVQPGRLPGVRQLMAMSRADFYRLPATGERRSDDDSRQVARHYVGAHMIIHMLLHNGDAYLHEFEAALQEIGSGATVSQAMNNMGERIGWDKFESDFQTYIAENFQNDRMRKGQMLRTSTFNAVPLESPTVNELSDSQVNTLFAMLGGYRDKPEYSAEAFAERAVQADSSDVDAQLVKLLLAQRNDPNDARQGLEGLWDAAPEHLGVQRALLEGLEDELPEQEKLRFQPVAERLVAEGQSARQLNAAAVFFAANGFSGRAISASEQSLQLDPRCWQCLRTYAYALGRLGQFAPAIVAQSQALEVAAELGVTELTARLQDELESLQAAARD